MMQSIQSYNLYQIPSTSQGLKPGESANFVIGSGVYQREGSFVQITFNNCNAGTSARIYQRADCCPISQAQCTVTFDGIQVAQYLSLTIQQLLYSQDELTFTGDRLDKTINGTKAQGAQTRKLFKEIAVFGTANTNESITAYYSLEHFFPNIWNKQDKYFDIKSNGTIVMNLGKTAFVDCLAQQVAGVGTANTNLLAALSAPADAAVMTVDITLCLKRVTNQVEQAAASISPMKTLFLQQLQSLAAGSATFNQSFAANQISTKQYQALVKTQGGLDQFSIEEFDTSVDGPWNIQRCGVVIVSASSPSMAKAQLTLQKGIYKKDFNNLLCVFDTVFSNADVQTQFTIPQPAGAADKLAGYLGYEYVMQI